MTDDTYSGWVNRETWATALHLSNDQGLYDEARVLCAGGPRQGADALRDWVTEEFERVTHPLPNDDPTEDWVRMMMSDVGSLWRVDWYAVAESFREE